MSSIVEAEKVIYEDNPYNARHRPDDKHKSAVDSVTTDVKNESDCGKLINRLLMCCVAVCLLWMTTLQVSVAIVSQQIPVPTMDSVIDSCSFAYSVIEVQREHYIACVDRQLSVCEVQYNKAYRTESDRVAHAEVSNSILAQSFRSVVNNCSSSFLHAKQSMKAWSEGGVGYSLPYYPNCSKADRQKVLNIIGSSSSGQTKTSLYDSAKDYSASSDTTASHFSTYASALSAYNSQYVNNKTMHLRQQVQGLVSDVSIPHMFKLNQSMQPIYSIMDDMVACVALGDERNGTCALPKNSLDLYNSYVISTNNWIEAVATDWYASLKSDIGYYIARVGQVVSNANNFYASVAGAAGVMRWLSSNIDLGVIGGSLCGHSTPNWCSFSPGDFSIWNFYLQPFPPVHLSPAPAVIWAEVMAAQANAVLNLTHVERKLQDGLTAWLSDLTQAIEGDANFIPSDYNPPKYPYAENTTVDNLTQQRRSNSFLASIQQLLQGSNLSTVSQFVGGISSRNISDTAAMPTAALSSFSTQWTSFTETSWQTALLSILNSVLTVQGMFYLFDFIYRALQTVKLVRKFWGKGVVKLPVVDLRTDTRNGKGDFSNRCFLYTQRLLEMLPLIWAQVLVLMYLLVFFVIMLFGVFMPEYNSYTAACVHHSANDTFISGNLFSLAMNYAALDGNNALLTGIGRYNLQLSSQCGSNYASSHSAFTAMESTLIGSNYSLYTTEMDLHAVSSCVDVSALDALYLAACCRSGAVKGGVYDDNFYNYYRCGSSAAATTTTPGLRCPSYTTATGTSAYLRPPGYYYSDTSCAPYQLLYWEPTIDDSSSISSTTTVTVKFAAANTNPTTSPLRQPTLSTTTTIPTLHPLSVNLTHHNVNTTSNSSHHPYANQQELISSQVYGRMLDSNFQCTALPPCIVSCSGPDVQTVSVTTKACSCMAEWFATGYAMRFFVAVLIYVLMNLSRYLICEGLVIVMWKSLTPKIFEISYNCDFDGRPLHGSNGFLTTKKHLQPDLEEMKEYPCYEDVYPNPSQHKESSESDSGAIAAIHKAKIQWAMRIFAAKGYFLVFIGLSLNALWMYVLYMAKSNIQYNA